jgi:hypothetical protein
MWVVGYYHINFLIIEKKLLEKPFMQSFTKLITFAQLLFKFKCSLLKPKSKTIYNEFLIWIPQHSY